VFQAKRGFSFWASPEYEIIDVNGSEVGKASGEDADAPNSGKVHGAVLG
jgi:hypothetical protein